ncbi:MAG: hypothetical protein AAFO07_13400 [Bacteroidota bacterium]
MKSIQLTRINRSGLNFFILVFCCLFILGSCSDSNQEDVQYRITYQKETDSTSNAYQDSLILNEDIVMNDVLSLPAANNWDEMVRLRGRSSWGTFDYICSIYNERQKRIQLIRQNIDQLPVSYSYHESILSDQKYDSILTTIKEYGFYKMPFDFTPYFRNTDGDEYSITVKSGNLSKTVYWQYPNHKGQNEEQFIKAERLFKYLILQANYPLPKALFRATDVEDSIYYELWLNDYELIMDVQAIYMQKELSNKNLKYALKIPKSANTNIKDQVTIWIELGDGTMQKIEEFQMVN